MSSIAHRGNMGSEEYFGDDKKKRREQIHKVATVNKAVRESIGYQSNGEPDKLLGTPIAFDIQPSEVIFKDVEPGQIYQMAVIVKNLTKTVKRIRVFQPKNSCFRCDYEMLGPIAPGLSIELVVSFESDEKGEFNDHITIISDNEIEYPVKISAFSPMAKIIYEPFINFGFIQSGKTKSESIMFRNEGSVDGRVTIYSDEIRDLKVNPRGQFLVAAGEAKYAEFSYTPREPGIFRGDVRVQVDGMSFADKIDVNATCVEFLRFIINEDGEEMNKVDFDTVLYGESKKISGHLVNNSPEGFYYRIVNISGAHPVYKEENNILSPHEQGMQQTRRIFRVEPNEGYVRSYDQVKLNFICKTWVEEEYKIWVRNYAMAHSGEKSEVEFKEDPQKSFQQSAVFFFRKNENVPSGIQGEEVEENKVIILESDSICPRVKFSKLVGEFGIIEMGDKRSMEINVQNDSTFGNITVAAPKLSVLSCDKDQIKLAPRGKSSFEITFQPKNLGKVDIEVSFMVNDTYSIPFRVIGHVQTASKTIGVNRLARSQSDARLKLKPIDPQELKELKESKDYLKESRIVRMQNKRSKLLQMQMSSVELRTKELMPKFAQRGHPSEPQLEDWMVNDIKFLFKENMNGLDAPRLEVPKITDPLFVRKPLGKYEPVDTNNDGEYNPDPTQQLRRLPEQPSTHAMMREINMGLQADSLRHIQAGPKTVDFGRVFIFSRTKRFFHIKNEGRTAIKARLMIDDEDLEESDRAPQIILTGQAATFGLVFLSKKPAEVSRILRYIINEKNIFKYMIKASAVHVDIEMVTEKVELSFPDDSNEMTCFKYVTLKNSGNNTAEFDWYSPVPGIFRVEPSRDAIEPGQIKKVKVIFSPTGLKPIEEETLDMRITHGLPRHLAVTGTAVETRCEASPHLLSFHSIAVGDTAKMNFLLKNTNGRAPAIFQVDAKSLGPYTKVSPMTGRVNAEGALKMEIEFCSPEQLSGFQKTLQILIRGSKPVNLSFTGDVIVPIVVVEEKKFDFGSVTYGNKSNLMMTLENTSPIVAKVTLDLRSDPDQIESEMYSCLKVTQHLEDGDDSRIMEEMDIDPEEIGRKKAQKFADEQRDIMMRAKSLDDILPSEDSQDGEEEDDGGLSEAPEHRDCFILTLKPNKKYKFDLEFTPQVPGNYSFNMPLALQGVSINPDLQRPVTCSAVSARIVLDPIDGMMDFGKKTITQIEGTKPDSLILKVQNPNADRSSKFYIDTRKLEEGAPFRLSKSEGIVPAEGQVDIVIEFRPSVPQPWIIPLPMYVDDEKNIPRAIITLKGTSAFPRILFDRREVIMPTTPLGIESRVTFYILNDGFQTVNLTGHIIETFQHFPIKIEFPEGPTLNSKRQKLKAELSYVSKIPLSFTTQLFIEDDQKTSSFSIFVSGTCDNSLLTNWSFFMRTPREDFEIVEREEKPVTVRMAERPASAVSGKNLSVTHSKRSKSSAATHKVNLGYPPLPFDILDRECRHIGRVISSLVPNFSGVSFPQDYITRLGEPLVKVVEYFSKSSLNIRMKGGPDLKKAERVSQSVERFILVINFLKREGAFLNSIRPEYLLGWSDLLLYYKTHDSPQTSPIANRLGETAHRYLSLDSWLTLMNQVLKLYLVGRITAAKVKGLPLLNDINPKSVYGTEISPILNIPEQLLLKWAESAFSYCRGEPMKLSYFDGSFGTGLPLASLIQIYSAGGWEPLRNMKFIPINRNEVMSNANEVKTDLEDMGVAFVPEIGEVAASEPRENVILLSILFNILPTYLPRETIFFDCKVGETLTKKVSIQNPSAHFITYNVRLQSSEDFSVRETQLKVDSKGSGEAYVTFTARISKPVTSRLTFLPVHTDESIVAPVVFDLKSKVSGRYTADRLIIKDVKLYDMKQKELKIANPFGKDCNFNITVEYLPSTPLDQTHRRRRLVPKKHGNDSSDKVQPFFTVNQEMFAIGKISRPKTLKINYFPLTFETHRCLVILSDDKVGELQYEIIGVPTFPDIMSMEYVSSMEAAAPQVIYPSFINPRRSTAYTNAMKQRPYIRSDKARAVLESLLNSHHDSETFKLECSAPKDLSFPSTVTLYDTNKPKAQEHGVTTGNTFQVSLLLRNPVKDYSLLLVMKNNDLTDVRVYEMKITLHPRVFKAALEFSTPVRIPIDQPIPVTNPCSTDVHFNITKDDGPNGEYFQVMRSFKVKAQSTEDLSVVFNPAWKGSASAVLKIMNPQTREEFHYIMKGTGEEPLSENHYNVVCSVGEEKKLNIIVENHESAAKEFRVSYEAFGVTGPSTIKVEANNKNVLSVLIRPNQGGIFAGCITLTDQTKRYIWYTMELDYKGKRDVRNMDISGVVRKPSVVDVEIENPLNERIEYRVNIKGEGLSGPSTVWVDDKGVSKYPLSFFPVRLLTGEGTVVFSHPKAGEIVLRLSLKSNEPHTNRPPPIKAEIGKTEELSIPFENPSGKAVRTTVQQFVSDTFSLSEKEFEIPPYSTKHIRIYYTPAELDVQDSVELVFLTPDMGSWKWIIVGKGIVPTQYPVKEYVLELQKDASGVVVFKNPFRLNITVNVKLELSDSRDEGAIELLLKKQKHSLQPGASLSIPLTFCPVEIKDYNATVLVSLTDTVTWRYPIRVITEAKSKTIEFVISTVCRKKAEKEFTLSLPGLTNPDPKEPYKLELLNITSGEVDIFKKWFTVATESSFIDPESRKLSFVVKFFPQKPVKTTGEVLVTRASGGKWRYKIALEATEPAPLDTIQIISALNVTSSVRFQLDSDSKTGEKFTAEFTYDSAAEFTVVPKSGHLGSVIKGGTFFTVSFTPVEYGKEKKGTLVIQTDSKYFSYQVTGGLPPYEPPKNVKGKVSEIAGFHIKKQ